MFSTIFQRFPTIFQRFPKICKMLSEGGTNVSELFRKLLKIYKIAEEDPKMFRLIYLLWLIQH